MEWFTKKRMLLISFLSTILFFVLYSNKLYFLCQASGVFSCGEILKFLKLFFLIAPFIFIFCVITYYLDNKVFFSLRKFTNFYLIIFFFLLLITPWYTGDEFLNLQKAHVSFLGSILYSVISLILILYKSFKKE